MITYIIACAALTPLAFALARALGLDRRPWKESARECAEFTVFSAAFPALFLIMWIATN
jgi:hypothetical protein